MNEQLEEIRKEIKKDIKEYQEERKDIKNQYIDAYYNGCELTLKRMLIKLERL